MSSPLGLTPWVSHFYKLNPMFTVGHLDHRMHHVLVHALHSTGMGYGCEYGYGQGSGVGVEVKIWGIGMRVGASARFGQL